MNYLYESGPGTCILKMNDLIRLKRLTCSVSKPGVPMHEECYGTVRHKQGIAGTLWFEYPEQVPDNWAPPFDVLALQIEDGQLWCRCFYGVELLGRLAEPGTPIVESDGLSWAFVAREVRDTAYGHELQGRQLEEMCNENC